MCFSATASFTAAAALLPAGIYCIRQVINVDKRYLTVAMIPIFFAFQQAVEGGIWLGFGYDMPALSKALSYVYLFFAYAFWPYYISFCMYSIEEHPLRRKIIHKFVWAGVLLGALLYLPIAVGIVPMTVHVGGHSIVYDAYLPALLIQFYTFAYACVLLMPTFISSSRHMNIFGALVLIALVLSIIWYLYAFTSAWCFFSALLSIYVAWCCYRVRHSA